MYVYEPLWGELEVGLVDLQAVPKALLDLLEVRVFGVAFFCLEVTLEAWHALLVVGEGHI